MYIEYQKCLTLINDLIVRYSAKHTKSEFIFPSVVIRAGFFDYQSSNWLC